MNALTKMFIFVQTVSIVCLGLCVANDREYIAQLQFQLHNTEATLATAKELFKPSPPDNVRRWVYIGCETEKAALASSKRAFGDVLQGLHQATDQCKITLDKVALANEQLVTKLSQSEVENLKLKAQLSKRNHSKKHNR